tara:strand:+ start:218 stop:445 length:228 start_codon:yes stop_codon:yes gene_type:complete
MNIKSTVDSRMPNKYKHLEKKKKKTQMLEGKLIITVTTKQILNNQFIYFYFSAFDTFRQTNKARAANKLREEFLK